MNKKHSKRKNPGAGGGDYYRIEVRPKSEFVTFRYHDVGKEGHVQRLAGQRESGSWDTQAWLISKEDAHVDRKRLVPDTDDARRVIATFKSEPQHKKADVFQAKDRVNVPEKEKPTEAQMRAGRENIQKAQSARHA